MPEGKIIPVADGEYPAIADLPPGSKVSFTGEATLVEGGLQIDSMDFETENDATRELKTMTSNGSEASPDDQKSRGF